MASTKRVCEELQQLIAAYSIGATDPQETAFVEEHLADCPDALAELAQYMDLADALLYTREPEPQAEPEPVHSVPPSEAQHIPAVSAAHPRPGSTYQQTLQKLQTLSTQEFERPRASTQNRWRMAAVLALFVVVASNAFWALYSQGLAAQNDRLSEQVAGLSTQQDDALLAAQATATAQDDALLAAQATATAQDDALLAAQATATAQDDALLAAQATATAQDDALLAAQATATAQDDALLAAQATATAQDDALLAAQATVTAQSEQLQLVRDFAVGSSLQHRIVDLTDETYGTVQAIFTWDEATQVGAFYVFGLAAQPEGTEYHLWLLRDGHSNNVGAVPVTEQEIGVLIFHSEEPITSYAQFVVTQETEASAQQPSVPHIVTGDL